MTEELKSRGDRKKQEEFYYLERGQMNINGCCTYSEGYYCGYHNSKAVGLEMQAWASSKTAKNVLRQLNKVKSQFAVQQQRSRVGDIVDALYNEDAPFEYTYRFDLFNTYILVGKFAAVIDQITSAASYKEKREDEKGDAVTIPISERKDLKRPDAGNQDWKFNDAQQQFNKGVREFEEMLSNGIWTYTRNRFENEVKILWCAGPPKCPQPKEDKECGPGPNGTKCPKPPPCEGTEYYARDLKKFLDAANPRGRKSDEWYINVFDNMNPNCQQLEDLTNVKNLLSNFKISSKGFLFSKRNKTEGDEKVHRILYDLNSEEYKDYKNIICPTSETTDDN